MSRWVVIVATVVLVMFEAVLLFRRIESRHAAATAWVALASTMAAGVVVIRCALPWANDSYEARVRGIWKWFSMLPLVAVLALVAHDSPIVAAQREYYGLDPGGFGAMITQYVIAGLLILCVAIIPLLAWLGSRVAGTFLRASRSGAVHGGLVVLGLLGALSAVSWTVVQHRIKAPSDRYLSSLREVQTLPKAGGYVIDERTGQLRVDARDKDDPSYCRFHAFRQSSDLACSAVVVRRNESASVWLIEAKTANGLEPIAWCRGKPGGYDCPDSLVASSSAHLVGPPQSWLVSAIVGLLLAVLGVTQLARKASPSVRQEGAAGLTRPQSMSLAALVAAACLAFGVTPLLLAMVEDEPIDSAGGSTARVRLAGVRDQPIDSAGGSTARVRLAGVRDRPSESGRSEGARAAAANTAVGRLSGLCSGDSARNKVQ